MQIKLTYDDAQEVLHKLCVLCDTPDLHESYGLTQEQANALCATVPHVKGGEWVVPEWAIEVVKGEMQDHAKILRACAEAAFSEREVGQSLRTHKQAKKFENHFA
jgi:hypothetical protein